MGNHLNEWETNLLIWKQLETMRSDRIAWHAICNRQISKAAADERRGSKKLGHEQFLVHYGGQAMKYIVITNLGLIFSMIALLGKSVWGKSVW